MISCLHQGDLNRGVISMKMIRTAVVGLLMALVFSTWSDSVFAENKDYTRYLSSKAHNAVLYQIWVLQSKRMCGSTEGPKSVVPLRFGKPQGFKFLANSKFPVAGIWSESWRGKACGREVIFNFICQGQNGKSPICEHLMPGATRTNYILQKDVFPNVLLQLKPKECPNPIPIHSEAMKISDFFGRQEKTTKGTFAEKWSFLACGEQQNVNLLFFPSDRGGMQFVVKLENQ